MGFILTPDEAQLLISKDSRNKDVLFPYLTGEDLNSRPDQSPSRWVINFFDWPIEKAMTYPDCFEIIQEKVKPERTRKDENNDFVLRKPLPQKWWIYADKRPELYGLISDMDRALVRSRVANINSWDFTTSKVVNSEATVVVADASYCMFAMLQNSLQSAWIVQYASSMRTDVRYTPSDCFETFPFPQSLNELEEIGGRYYARRQHIMLARKEGLTKTYNRFHDPEEASADIQKLRELHVEMDQSVAAAYGWTDLNLDHGFHETKQGVRFTISESARREVLARLLTLNHERYAAEVSQGLHDTKAKRPTTSKPKAAAKPKPVAESPTLFDDDDATFPGTERDNYLCGLVCDLVAADPGLSVAAYVDSLVIALGHERHKRLLTGRDATKFAKLCKATPLAGWSATDKIPWAELQNLLQQRKAIMPDGEALQPGPDWAAVRESYPSVDLELLALLRKAAAELRDLQAQVGSDDVGTPDAIPAEKAEILRAFVDDRDQWYGVAA